MKKIIFTLVLTMSMLVTISAQDIGKTIGIRFGYGGEISYQQPLGDANRLEVDLGLNHYGFGIYGIYQWVWDLSALADGFNWYAGAGASIGSFYLGNSLVNRNKDFNVGLVGQVGIEYNFNIPLQLSLDYRPGFYFVNGFAPTYDGICLAARYRF
jgi:hypothetical protein